MKYKKPDLSALNHAPLQHSVPAYTAKHVEATGLMKLSGVRTNTHEVAERVGFFRRVLGRKSA
ncbi:hypothetical protein [Cerasicoccus frondis]|uniref:hypothetical protein n=1 Tax=Cerasicoccus frondis TaxID=490090 RepID=UPI0028528C93|nr:hypothetical protein [Cerasicoccus frondis]